MNTNIVFKAKRLISEKIPHHEHNSLALFTRFLKKLYFILCDFHGINRHVYESRKCVKTIF